jgi:hypothetical protein
MFKAIIRHWFHQWEQEPRAVPGRQYFEGGMRVIPIRNGYLVQWGADPYGSEAMVSYCKDAKEIAETIISVNTETRLKLLPQQSISGTAQNKPYKTAY